MYLHEDEKVFRSLLRENSEATGIDEAIIEKDYYVTLVLRKLVEKEPLVIFKGGTCLSKCYGIVNRLSEKSKLLDFPKNTIFYDYASESAGLDAGYATFIGGEVWEGEPFNDESRDDYEAFFDLWGREDEFEYDEEI